MLKKGGFTGLRGDGAAELPRLENSSATPCTMCRVPDAFISLNLCESVKSADRFSVHAPAALRSLGNSDTAYKGTLQVFPSFFRFNRFVRARQGGENC